MLIQSENPKRLYPPKLIIEYATSVSGSWSADLKNKETLVFKVEYAMKTENFWSTIQVMIGFVFAFAVVVFGVRMNNWQSRQRANDSESSFGSMTGFHFIFHGVMVACHTFVLLFFPFLFLICCYW